MRKGAHGGSVWSVWPRPLHSPDGTWHGRQGDEGSWALHPPAAMRPYCSSRLQLGAEAPGGQAASLQDRPPTRHIRTAGRFPGPAGLWPLALTQNPPPYGLPREDERRKRSKKEPRLPLDAQGPSWASGRGG